MDESPRAISRASISFLTGTLLSRLSGLGRDMAMAFAFGSQPAIAAFMVAFRFANAIRRLFGEGNLPSGFVPHFEQMRASSTEKAAHFYRDLLFSLAIFLAVLIGLLDIGLVAFWKCGFLNSSNAEILHLTLLMMPGILFICLFGLNSALLQCEKRFFLSGVAPVGFNAVWIAAAFVLKNIEASNAMVYLSLAIVIAFFAQWMMTVPPSFGFLKKTLTWRQILRPTLFSSELKKMIAPLFLGAVGVGAMQINSALDAVFARCASLEGPAYLWYAIRIEQLPLALFGISLSSALLPSLSRAMKNQEIDNYAHLLRFALKRVFSLIFPCSIGMFVLGASGINLLYGRGGFNEESTYHTILCLWGYGLGLIPSVFVLILASGFYAAKDYRIPTIGCIFSVIANIVLNTLFVFGFGWGAFSIALSTSLSALFNFLYLLYHLKKRFSAPFFDFNVRISLCKTGIAAIVAGIIGVCVGHFLIADPTLSMLYKAHVFFTRNFVDQVVQFVCLSGTFFLIFFSCVWLINAEDVLELCRFRDRQKDN